MKLRWFGLYQVYLGLMATTLLGCVSGGDSNSVSRIENRVLPIRPGQLVNANELSRAYEDCAEAATLTVMNQIFKTGFHWEYMDDPAGFKPSAPNAIARVKDEFLFTVMNLENYAHGDWSLSEKSEMRIYVDGKKKGDYLTIHSVKGVNQSSAFEVELEYYPAGNSISEEKIILANMPHFVWKNFTEASTYNSVGGLNFDHADLAEVNLVIPADASSFAVFKNLKTEKETAIRLDQFEYANCLKNHL